MTGKKDTSCPACEYNHGKRGRPTLLSGEMVCLDCGNHWRELGQSQLREVGDDKNTENTLSLDNLFDQRVSCATDELSQLASASKKAGFKGVALAVSLLAAGIVSMIVFFEVKAGKQRVDGLHVVDLQFEELVRQNQSKVVRVTGTINNAGGRAQRVKPLALILRKSNGSELTRWYYNSHVGKLGPGEKSRFVSSIQYDTPVIASVDAVFQ